MDESVKDKEEIKRRLDEMKQKYAKMQRKLTKSERRRSAKNHVRRVLAEQANASSPGIPAQRSGTEETCIEKDVSEGDKDGGISRRSGRRSRSLQRSISFRLEESLEEDPTDGGTASNGPTETDLPDTGGNSSTPLRRKTCGNKNMSARTVLIPLEMEIAGTSKTRSSKGSLDVERIEECDEEESTVSRLGGTPAIMVRKNRAGRRKSTGKVLKFLKKDNTGSSLASQRDGKKCLTGRETGKKLDSNGISVESGKDTGALSEVTMTGKGINPYSDFHSECLIELENLSKGSKGDLGDKESSDLKGRGRSQEVTNAVRREVRQSERMLHDEVDQNIRSVVKNKSTSATLELGDNMEHHCLIGGSSGVPNTAKDLKIATLGESADHPESSSSVKVSRLSHRKKSRRSRGHLRTDWVNSAERNSIASSSGETPSDLGETADCLLNSAGSDLASSGERAGAEDEVDILTNKGNGSTDEDRGITHLIWQGIFQDQVSHQENWSGIDSCEIGSRTALVMYQTETVLLWVYSGQWQTCSQWTADKDSSITDVTLGSSQDSNIVILVSLTKAAKNWISFISYNLDADTQEVEDITLPRTLEESPELKMILSGHQGALMERTEIHLCNIHFFETTPKFNLWQLKCLKEFNATSFIAVERGADVYLSLSADQLNIWSSITDGPLLEVDLSKTTDDVRMDECLWSKTEEGLLFLVTLQRPSSLALHVLNPATGIVLHLHNFMVPCAYQSLSLQDLSVSGYFVAAVYSNDQTLLWDVFSGRALTEMQSPDGHTNGVTATSDSLILNGKHPHLYQLSCGTNMH